MAYEPDFYVPENIIGYTGVLSKNPTVYFLSKTSYGHITQVHAVRENIGRELISPNSSYEFGNRDGKFLFESDPDRGMKHRSRSPMVLVKSDSIPPELTHAIMVHPEKKARQIVRGREVVNITDENQARFKHPGQEPSEEDRAEAANGLPVLVFWWTRTAPSNIPAGTRLGEITSSLLS